MLIDVQFKPAGRTWAELRDATRRAEADGYGTAWIFDHLRGTTLRGEGQMLECCTLLGALAASTTTIGLGTMVANVAVRHPAILAHAVASAQRISGGRVTAGIGAGAAPGSRWAAELEEAGIPLRPAVADRHAAVVAQITALRAETNAAVLVGANSIALATLAGTHADGLNVRLAHPQAQELIAAGRRAAPDRPFEISAYTPVDDPATRQLAKELGVSRLIVLAEIESV